MGTAGIATEPERRFPQGAGSFEQVVPLGSAQGAAERASSAPL